MKQMYMRRFCLVCVFFVLLISCSRRGSEFHNVDREVLFSLSYGAFEDELNLFDLDAPSVEYPAQLYMSDGIFYIANGTAKKVMQFTSYGDLMGLYFNAAENPVPSFIDTPDAIVEALKDSETVQNTIPDTKQKSATMTTRRAISFPFNYPEFISVDSRKIMYIADQLPEDRMTLDMEFKVLLKDVVMCFQSDGTYLGYLGQEGMGGAAFPAVTGIYNNQHNDIIVVCRIMNGHIIFWYDSAGVLKYRIPVTGKKLPPLESAAGKSYAQLETVVPSRTADVLYMKADYFSDSVDRDTNANEGLQFQKSAVLVFDIMSNSFKNDITIPVYTDTDIHELDRIRLYELLGVTADDDLYFIMPVDSGYALQIINVPTLHVYKRFLHINDDESEYQTFMLSEDGILSALVASPFNAKVVWWKEGLGHE